ncbi:hypothetical protein VNO80_16006 [Phaseolus coccineus]|uniref:Uncharacterized protein n=1 Tax=Phaseolus coccineus TaxID=3886 RepID=A0AAN9MLA7_PHACN
MTLAPGQSPYASRALAMPACLSRSGDARMSRALAMSACLSRPGNARMSRALAINRLPITVLSDLLPDSPAILYHVSPCERSTWSTTADVIDYR